MMISSFYYWMDLNTINKKGKKKKKIKPELEGFVFLVSTNEQHLKVQTMSWRIPRSWAIALIASIAGLIASYDTGMAPTSLNYFSKEHTEEWVKTYLILAGLATSLIGIIGGSWLADSVGRRSTLQIADGLYMIGSLTTIFAKSPWPFIVGRVFTGVGVGIISIAPPLYIGEVSISLRGSHVATYCVQMTLGHLFSEIVNSLLPPPKKEPKLWRLMFVVPFILALAQFLLLLRCPRSPWWLGKKGKFLALRKALRDIYQTQDIEELADDIKSMILENAEENETFLTNVLAALGSKEMRSALTSGILVQSIQQYLGVKTIFFYLPKVIQKEKKLSLLFTIIVPILECVGTIIGMITVDKIGRRPLLLTSSFSLVIAICLYGVKHFCGSDMRGCSNSTSVLAPVLFVLYILFYSPGMDTVPWIVNVEFFPFVYRSIGGGIGAVGNWLSNIIVSHLSEIVQPDDTLFFLYTVISICMVVYLCLYFPETKGMPIEESWTVFEMESSTSTTSGEQEGSSRSVESIRLIELSEISVESSN